MIPQRGQRDSCSAVDSAGFGFAQGLCTPYCLTYPTCAKRAERLAEPEPSARLSLSMLSVVYWSGLLLLCI
jgi:hypothetical protein